VRIRLLLILILVSSAAFAQRKGSIDTGGYFAFRSTSENDTTTSILDIDWSFGFYMTSSFLIEVQPSIQLDILNGRINSSNTLLSNFTLRLIDMEPDEFRRRRSMKYYDRTTAGIFAFMGGGLWYAGQTNNSQETSYSVGPAFSLGISTHTPLGNIMLAKTKIQYVYLSPSGNVYDSARTVFKIGAGLSIFLRL
jgi:hypothetical protein